MLLPKMIVDRKPPPILSSGPPNTVPQSANGNAPSSPPNIHTGREPFAGPRRSETELVESGTSTHAREGVAHTEYADNFLALSRKEVRTSRATTAVRDAFEDRGLPTHECTPASLQLDSLGWTLKGEPGVNHGKNERRWRLRLSILEVLRRGSATGKTIEVIVGH